MSSEYSGDVRSSAVLSSILPGDHQKPAELNAVSFQRFSYLDTVDRPDESRAP